MTEISRAIDHLNQKTCRVENSAKHTQEYGGKRSKLTEENLVHIIHPLFRKTLCARQNSIYLANHSLGRPLDRTLTDIEQAALLWYEKLDDAWDEWLIEREHFRASIARLIHAPSGNCIVPKDSAGQGLRTILNSFEAPLRVVSSADEFNSIDHILKLYQDKKKISLTTVVPGNGTYQLVDFLEHTKQCDLLVLSSVMYSTGQWLNWMDELIDTAHESGCLVLLDLYHSAGVIPVDIGELNADFAIGGCYKYLRGGPGAGWLYVHPSILDQGLRSLDSGWFAQPDPFQYRRSNTAQFARGGDGLLESTPAFLPWYQARAGLEFILHLGVDRLREYSVEQKNYLISSLANVGIEVNCSDYQGAFITFTHDHPQAVLSFLSEHHITVDTRENLIRLCPDILNTRSELDEVCYLLKEFTLGKGPANQN